MYFKESLAQKKTLHKYRTDEISKLAPVFPTIMVKFTNEIPKATGKIEATENCIESI